MRRRFLLELGAWSFDSELELEMQLQSAVCECHDFMLCPAKVRAKLRPRPALFAHILAHFAPCPFCDFAQLQPRVQLLQLLDRHCDATLQRVGKRAISS